MKALYIILALALTFMSCSESVLSDVEITDPHLLDVKVKIEQDSNNDKEVQVFIRDTKGRPIHLLTGKVIVNDHVVLFDRATVNAAGARGYIYTPYNNEQVFEITIYWNSIDYHTVLLSPATGWPGFYCNHSHAHEENLHFARDNYSLKGAPFNDHEIEVSYTIIDEW
jgi:hypothetical protein